jgi:hypothetical protein
MPLSAPAKREFATRRKITCEGYIREDGLFDIEGRLLDVRGHDISRDWRDEVKAGEPIHDISVRLTIDDSLVIRSVEAVSEAVPFPSCRDANSNMQRLLGLTISGGFKRAMQQAVGGVAGCTHVRTLLDNLAGVAIHTVASKHRNESFVAFWSSWRKDPSKPPALIDSCHSYAADSPNVRRLLPMFYRPPGDKT